MSSIRHRGEVTPPKATMRRKKKKVELKFTPVLNVDIDAKTLGCIAMELINHLLYACSQIPMPLAMLSQIMERKRQETELNDNTQVTVKKHFVSMKAFKKENFIKQLSTASTAIRDLFQHYNVRKIALIVGSTIVSPKEIFLIDVSYFTTTNLEKPDRPDGSVVRRFLRDIVMDENISELEGIPLQRLHIMFSLDSYVELDENLSCSFIPKLNYQLPNRGLLHTFTLTAQQSTNTVQVVDSSTNTILCNVIDTDHWYASNGLMKGFK